MMPLVVRKTTHTGLGDTSMINPDDKLDLIKIQYRALSRNPVPYDQRKQELRDYSINLPEDFDIPQISNINKLYAQAQSYLTRVSAIESEAISNSTNWHRLNLLMKEYLAERESEMYVSEEILDLPNAKARDSAIRHRLRRIYNTLNNIHDKYLEAESFYRLIEIKKKDLQSIVTNLNRQVKALQTEKSGTY